MDGEHRESLVFVDFISATCRHGLPVASAHNFGPKLEKSCGADMSNAALLQEVLPCFCPPHPRADRSSANLLRTHRPAPVAPLPSAWCSPSTARSGPGRAPGTSGDSGAPAVDNQWKNLLSPGSRW